MNELSGARKRQTRRGLLIASTWVLLGAFSAPSAWAEPEWTAPATLDAPNGIVLPRLDRARDGTSFLSYDTSGSPRFRTRSLGAGFGPELSFPTVVTGSTGNRPAMFGFTDAGDAIVAWEEAGLHAVHRTSGGIFGTVQNLGSIGGGYSYDLAVDGAGNALLVSVTSSGAPSLVFRTRPAGSGSTFSSAQTIASGASSYAVSGVILEDDGRAALLYKSDVGGMVGLTKLPGESAFGSPQILEAPVQGSVPFVAKNRAGRMVAIWSDVLPGGMMKWRGVVRNAGSDGFEQPLDLSPAVLNIGNGSSVAIDSSGHGVALFAVAASPGPCGPQSSTSSLLFSEALPDSNQFTFGTTVVPAGDLATAPSIAISDGRIAAMWNMKYGSDAALCEVGGNYVSDLRTVVTPEDTPPGLLASQVLVADHKASFGALLVADESADFTATWLRSPGTTLAASSIEFGYVFGDGFESGNLDPWSKSSM